ncbi:MAG: hypothetical protein U9R68_07710 [Planctomycetota bacterium]|nr:hypothetical protein [Planctomycetota bacterium]
MTKPNNNNHERYDAARRVFNKARAELDRLRIRQHALLCKMRDVKDELNQLDKLDTADLQEKGDLNRIWRRAKANLELMEIDLEQTAVDIREHAAGAARAKSQMNAANKSQKSVKSVDKKL